MLLKTIHKTAWLSGGVIFLLLAVIGLLLPVVPQLPFLVLSAVCFIRCSPRFNNWLQRQHWFAKFHGWADQKKWFRHLKKHLPTPDKGKHRPS